MEKGLNDDTWTIDILLFSKGVVINDRRKRGGKVHSLVVGFLHNAFTVRPIGACTILQNLISLKLGESCSCKFELSI